MLLWRSSHTLALGKAYTRRMAQGQRWQRPESFLNHVLVYLGDCSGSLKPNAFASIALAASGGMDLLGRKVRRSSVVAKGNPMISDEV